MDWYFLEINFVDKKGARFTLSEAANQLFCSSTEKNFLKMGVSKSTFTFNFCSNPDKKLCMIVKCSLACPTSENLFRMTGLYNPPAIFDEFWELLSTTKTNLSFCKAISENEIPANPEPIIK